MDASIHATDNAMGLAWVLRDHTEFFFAAKNLHLDGVYTVNEAEAIAMRETLSWLKNTGMRGVDVEMDSQSVFHAISYPSFYSAFGVLIDDVKEMASLIHDVQFYFVKRPANCAAHTLAREACSVSGYGEWFDTPPALLVSCLFRDLMN
ncbi:PREDICTED: uncharacterized protein LOC109155163 [Ipomoea nil]|uniref:uncharacterized protein LOC109155163 n=1 Tax=Ipomoea nil TaxID=35883 RepID=UPI000901FE50|nr:PREDICTED: uncharacterized protein LOC109155163 [Ipomoea nil]